MGSGFGALELPFVLGGMVGSWRELEVEVMDGGVCHLVLFCCMEMGAGRGLCYPAKSEAIVLESISKNNVKHVPGIITSTIHEASKA